MHLEEVYVRNASPNINVWTI